MNLLRRILEWFRTPEYRAPDEECTGCFGGGFDASGFRCSCTDPERKP